MPLHRQRIVQKKINRSNTLINLDHNKIPSVFVSLISIVVIAGATVWLINSNITTKPSPQVAAVIERKNGSIDIDPNNAKIEQTIKQNDSNNSTNNVTAADTIKSDTQNTPIKTDTPTTQTITKTDNPENKPIETTEANTQTKTELTRIPASALDTENINIKELNCSVTFSKTAPAQINLVTKSDNFWIPNTNCKNTDLQLIQIFSSKTKPKFENVQVESLDQDTEYALFYWKDPKINKDINLDNYLVPLTRFISNGKLYFNVKDAFDKLQFNNKDTYYLAGNCDGNSKGACILWGLPSNGSLVSLLTEKGVANTATGQENNLQKGQYLKFAKTQDRNNRIALILNKSNNKIDIIYIDPTKSYAIDEIRSYEKDTANYNKYFR